MPNSGAKRLRISQTEKEVLSKAKKGMVGRCRKRSEGNGCQEGW